MLTQFVTTEVALQGSPGQLQQAIATALQRWGNPLRWAITAVNTEQQVVQIEAVVTVDANPKTTDNGME